MCIALYAYVKLDVTMNIICNICMLAVSYKKKKDKTSSNNTLGILNEILMLHLCLWRRIKKK